MTRYTVGVAIKDVLKVRITVFDDGGDWKTLPIGFNADAEGKAGFMKTVLSEFTLLKKTIYLSLSAQVAEGTLFRKYIINSSQNYLAPFTFFVKNLFNF